VPAAAPEHISDPDDACLLKTSQDGQRIRGSEKILPPNLLLIFIRPSGKGRRRYVER